MLFYDDNASDKAVQRPKPLSSLVRKRTQSSISNSHHNLSCILTTTRCYVDKVQLFSHPKVVVMDIVQVLLAAVIIIFTPSKGALITELVSVDKTCGAEGMKGVILV